jgi:hypothetical protein
MTALLEFFPVIDDATVFLNDGKDRSTLFFESLQARDFLLVCRKKRVRVDI